MAADLIGETLQGSCLATGVTRQTSAGSWSGPFAKSYDARIAKPENFDVFYECLLWCTSEARVGSCHGELANEAFSLVANASKSSSSRPRSFTVDFTATITPAMADDLRELFENLDESSLAAYDSLTSLRKDLKLTVRSSLGFTLRLGGSHPVTLTSIDHLVAASDIATSLRLPLSWIGPEEIESSIVFYAGVPGALVDLAADIAYGLSLRLDQLRLDEDLTPELVESGIVGMEEASTVSQAIGVLLTRGHTCETAQAELRRQAGEARQSVYNSATMLLLAVGSG